MRSILIMICLLLALLPGTAADDLLPAPPVERLIVISLDGARPDALQQADAPIITALAARGAADWAAQTILPPATLPAHASMLTGLALADHGVDWNGTNIGCPPIEAPTFLTLAAEAGYKTAMVVGKQKLCHFHQTETVNYTFARAGDRSVVDRAIELIDADYTVIFAHLPNPDYFGHLTEWMSATYRYELSNTDAQVGRLLSALERVGALDTSLVILTADHGGLGDSHGRDIPEDRLIPWLIAGPCVAAGSALDPGQITDTAATALWALDLPLPADLAGHPRTDAFLADCLNDDQPVSSSDKN